MSTSTCGINVFFTVFTVGADRMARNMGPDAINHEQNLAPQGAKACSLGRQPQVAGPTHVQKPQRGGGSVPRSVDLPSPLRGSGIVLGLPFLGLAPQATCLCPLRGKIPASSEMYIRGWVETSGFISV